jgi:hypothetical protein
MTTATDTLDKQRELDGLSRALDDARSELRFFNEDFERKRDAWTRSGKGFEAAEKARVELNDKRAEIKALEKRQVAVLESVGTRVARRGMAGLGSDWQGDGDGWSQIAQELDLAEGRNRVDVPLGDLLDTFGSITVTPSSGLKAPALMQAFIAKAQDQRHIHEAFPVTQLDPTVLAIADYRQTGSRTVTGSVERDPASTESKAKLALSVELETPPLKQQAIVLDDVPVKLIEAIEGFDAFLRNEMVYQLNLALDAHTLAQITAAAPPSGKEGTTLIEQVRNGVKAMRALGGQPRVLALSPDEAAELDTIKTGTGGLEQYVFGAKATGSAAPLWGLAIVEVPGLEVPTLLDPALAAQMYLGLAKMLIDPYSGLDTNTVRLRLEVESLLHIRDVAGVYQIA